jgi:hypothetical protein
MKDIIIAKVFKRIAREESDLTNHVFAARSDART